MSAVESRRAHATAAEMRRRIEEANRRPPTSKEVLAGEVLPFPISRQRRYVETELKSVQDYDDVAAFRWLRGKVGKHRSKLKAFGVAPDRIEADAQALVEAFGIGDTMPKPPPIEHATLFELRNSPRTTK